MRTFDKLDRSQPTTMKTITYCTIHSLEIQLDLFVPEHLPSGLVPALVFFHGGGMVSGGRKTLVLQQWLKGTSSLLALNSDFSHILISHSIITDAALAASLLFISADYRLIHPSTGPDIIADVKALFSFLASPSFSRNHLSSSHVLESSRIAVSGESGGGYPALAACILASPKPKVLLQQYGMGGEFLSDNWIMPKDVASPVPGAEKVTRAGLAGLLERWKREETSYDAMAMTGDEGAVRDSGRLDCLSFWWREGAFLDYVVGREGFTVGLRDVPFQERERKVPQELKGTFLQFEVDGSFPAAVWLHGREDPMVMPEESERPHRKLKECGVRSESLMVEGAGHALLDAGNPPKLIDGAGEVQGRAWEFVLEELRR